MRCPKCASSHTMSTTKKESIIVKWMVHDNQYAHTERDDKTVTHKCLDCGHEWEG